MANSVYMGMSAALASQKRLDVAANNIANVNTTGFRQQRVVFSDFLVETMDGRPSEKGFSAVTETVIDRQTGGLEHTGNPLDVALGTEGFFVLQGPQGGPVLSRAGNFRVEADGSLVDNSGYRVLGGTVERGFAPITTRPEGGPVRVNTDGSVEQDGTLLATLAVVTADATALIPLGGAHLQAPAPALRSLENPDLAPGYLEGSNVNPVRGMVDLIEINRDYHHATKAMAESRKLDEAIIKIAR